MSDSNNGYAAYGTLDGKAAVIILNIMALVLGSLFLMPSLLSLM